MQINRTKIRARRNLFLLITMIIIILGGAIHVINWWVWDRYWVTTDNAFVTGNLVPVRADATGIVVEVLKEETEYVKKGELVIALDAQRAHAILDEAEGELGLAVRTVGALFETRAQMCQKIISRNALLDKVHHDVVRYRQVVANGSISKQVVQNAEDQENALGAELKEAKAEFKAINARLGKATRVNHPEIKSRRGKYVEAHIEFERQRISAPVTGYVAKRKSQVGDRVKPGDQLMTIVPLDHLWVEANLWESSMRNIRPGQPALITADLYGASQTYHGRVEGLVPGTGSVFAILPPDNATGNFIHIVQRVPVRIGLDRDELLRQPLRPGLSTVTSIDVRQAERLPNAALTEVTSKEYATNIYGDDFVNAEREADRVIQENLIQDVASQEPLCHESE
jgi:membrane fusion protein (multidrug efflux system)